MKKYIITVMLLFFSILALNNFYNYSYAASSAGTIISEGDSFIERGKNTTNIETFDGKKFRNSISIIFGTLYIIGVVISVIVIAILGIQIMIGSAEEKAEIKEKMIPYLVGTVVIFASYPIWKMVMLIAGNFS